MRLQLSERFWGKVDKSAGTDSCWKWNSAKDKRGYCTFHANRKTVNAHRMAWELYNKDSIPSGMCVCHSCDVPDCVNPNHLWIGTFSDNMHDAYDKGRKIAHNSLKTYCKRGHDFVPENTYMSPSGKRTCRTCKNMHQQERRAMLRE
jgi:hypothetical protein